MCGINGLFSYNVSANPPSRDELLRSRDAMAARGPDGVDEWWSDNKRLGFGHRRLSIIDPQARSDQPMISDCGRYVIVFNGEIYNFPDLRKDLESKGVKFRTTSDTEAILHLYMAQGEAMVGRLRGMFAFAIWDNKEQTLFLARDPYGIKPLYIADDGWTFSFASQVKALLKGGRISDDPEPAGIVGFHLWGSVPEPFTLYRDIRALPAGHTLFVDAAGPKEPKSYCSVAEVFCEGEEHALSKADTLVTVREAIRESVKAHLLADVEVGIFLSAGVDSGALLGLMRDAGAVNTKAITLGFEEFQGSSEDEVPMAAKVAEKYGAEHIVRIVSEQEFREDLPLFLERMDQPSIDGINTWFVSKAAQEAGLKVALSGLGGDEILAGYSSFTDVPRWAGLFRPARMLPGAGVAARKLINALGVAKNNPKAANLFELGGTYPGAYLLKRGLLLPSDLRGILDEEMVRTGLERLAPLQSVGETLSPTPKHKTSKVAVLESTNYMRNQLLRDADWAGMAHSIEIRTPLVYIEMCRAVSKATPSLSGGLGKQALASAPSEALPDEIVNKPKTGFRVPTGDWLANASQQVASNKGLASRAWAHEVFSSFAPGEPARTELYPQHPSEVVL